MTNSLTTNLAVITQSAGITYPQLAKKLTVELPELTNYLAGTAPFPAYLLPNFCRVVDSLEPFEILLAPLNCRVMPLTKAHARTKELTTRIAQLEQQHAQLLREARA